MSENTPVDTDPTADWSFETKQVHAGQGPDSATNARALPIYQTTSYVFDNTDHAAALFGLAEPGNIYTRIMNPTQDAVEQRIAALEGGVAALLVASGQAAESFAILNLAEAGDHIVSSPRLYGGTYNLFHYTLPKLGITVDFVEDPDNLDHWREAIRPNTKAFYGEPSPTPRTTCSTSPASAQSPHEHGIPLIVDNTVATPYLIQPLKHGADIVVHSATKYLGGHGTAIAGVIVDGGTFDWTQGTPHQLHDPRPQLPRRHLCRSRCTRLRPQGTRSASARPRLGHRTVQRLPHLAGIETLSLRIERHVSNAQKVAEFLEGRAEVTSVAYAGLPSSPWHERGKQLAPKGTGAIVAFELAGGVDAGKKFVNALTLHSHVANIGDVRSLVIHPASTTHSQLTPEEQLASGVTPGLVRLAVGIEGIDDILADLETGLAAAAS